MNNYLIIYNNLLSYLDLYNIIKIRHVCKEFYHIFKILKFDALIEKFDHHDKIGKFNFLIYHYSHLPKQGSIEWLNQRKGLYKDDLDNYITIPKQYTVGGSEISTLLCVNPYSSIRVMAERKLHTGSEFNGNTSTRWGNMFEPVITEYTEKYFSTSINEFGSIPLLYDNQMSPIARYSPDGIGIIKKENLQHLRTDNKIKYDIQNNNIVLFEFKCPIRRMLKDEVPVHYVNQPLMGMAGMSVVDFSIFGDAVFRKCSISEFGFNDMYDKIFHTFDRKKFNKPVFCGLIFIYDPKYNNNELRYNKVIEECKLFLNYNVKNKCEPTQISSIFDICKKYEIYDIEFIKEIIGNYKNNNIIELVHKYFTNEYDINLLKIKNDLGNSSRYCESTFSNILHQVEKGDLCLEYCENYLTDTCNNKKFLFNNITKIQSKIKNNNLMILPYKLCDIKFIPIKKDKEYFNKYACEIYNFVEKIQKIRKSESTIDVEFPLDKIDHVKYLKTQKKYKNSTPVKVQSHTYTKNNITYTEITDEEFMNNLL